MSPLDLNVQLAEDQLQQAPRKAPLSNRGDNSLKESKLSIPPAEDVQIELKANLESEDTAKKNNLIKAEQ